MKKHPFSTLLFLVVCAAAAVAQSESDHLTVSLGIQAFDVDGSEARYRSQVNQRDGLSVGQFTWLHTPPDDNTRFLDRLRLDVSGFGANPQGNLRFKADKNALYHLDLTYVQADFYSDVPGWVAWPTTGLDQSLHTYDRQQDRLDMDLELFPTRQWRPTFSFKSRNLSGPGWTTQRVGEDEYAVNSQLRDREHEVSLGLNYHGDRFFGQVVQGYRIFKGKESRSLLQNGSQGYLGDSQFLDQLQSESRVETQTPVTRASLSGSLTPQLEMTSYFTYADGDTESEDREELAGHVVLRSFRERLIFDGRETYVSARAKNPNWRGLLKLNARLPQNLKASLSWQQDRRQVTGSALFDILYLDAISFGELETRDLQRLSTVENLIEREDRLLTSDLAWQFRPHWRLWGSAQWLQREVDIDVGLDQMVILDRFQEGSYDRQWLEYTTGIAYQRKKTSAQFTWETADADRAIVRTDFLKRDRLKFRGKTQQGPWFFSTFLTWSDYKNQQAAIALDGNQWQAVLESQFRFPKGSILGGSFGRYSYMNESLLRNPATLQTFEAKHREEGHHWRSFLQTKLHKSQVELSGSYYENKGLFPCSWLQTALRADWPLSEHLTLQTGFHFRDYAEKMADFADFEALGAEIFIQWTQ